MRCVTKLHENFNPFRTTLYFMMKYNVVRKWWERPVSKMGLSYFVLQESTKFVDARASFSIECPNYLTSVKAEELLFCTHAPPLVDARNTTRPPFVSSIFLSSKLCCRGLDNAPVLVRTESLCFAIPFANFSFALAAAPPPLLVQASPRAPSVFD